MRNITNELIEAWEDSGEQALPMGLQGLLIADIAEAAKQGGRQDLLMNAAGQISGLLNEIRPAAEVLEEMVPRSSRSLHLPSPRQRKSSGDDLICPSRSLVLHFMRTHIPLRSC